MLPSLHRMVGWSNKGSEMHLMIPVKLATRLGLELRDF